MGKKGKQKAVAKTAPSAPAAPAPAPQVHVSKLPMSKCNVALLTPTFNRQRFLPFAARCFLKQEAKWCKQIYWYILDDSDDPCDDIVRGAVGADVFAARVRYTFVPLRMTVAEKRNAIIERAYRDGMHIFAAFDDDDWYGPTYVKHVTQALMSSSIALAGASSVYLYMAGIDKVARTDPIPNYPNKQKGVRECRHTCNGVLCFRRDYWEANHRYSVVKRFAEEGEFCDAGEGPFSAPIIQLDNTHVFNVALNHMSNTFDKEQLLDKPNQILKTSHEHRIEDIIGPHDAEFLAFWKLLDAESRAAREAATRQLPSAVESRHAAAGAPSGPAVSAGTAAPGQGGGGGGLVIKMPQFR